ncbi:hypothetical protein F4860DRAFT_321361 [Xylaria cubensis]|nr:hypothetical protein F4860DRAFT_321361 [Xylaria cubensis]
MIMLHHLGTTLSCLLRLTGLFAFALCPYLLPQPLLHFAERSRLRTLRHLVIMVPFRNLALLDGLLRLRIAFHGLSLVSRGSGSDALTLLGRGLVAILESVGCQGCVGLAWARASGIGRVWLTDTLCLGSRGGNGKLGCGGCVRIHHEDGRQGV